MNLPPEAKIDRVVYISGPMSGIPEHNFPLFERIATSLRGVNRVVISPHEFPNKGKSWEDCLRYDLIWVCQCNAIALLPGWEGSAGSLLELAVAKALGMPVYTVMEAHGNVSLVRRNSAYPLPPQMASEFADALSNLRVIKGAGL